MVGTLLFQRSLHSKSVWELHFGVKCSAKEKILKVPPLPHSPNKMGVVSFSRTQLVLISADAIGQQLLSEL